MRYLKDMYVTGDYYGHTVTGKVRDSRVRLGGEIIHYVDLDPPQPVGCHGVMRECVILTHGNIKQVMDNIGE